MVSLRMTLPVYPVLEVWVTYAKDGVVAERRLPGNCWHDLFTSDQELAGMGLAIISGLVRTLHAHLYDEALGAKLLLKRWPGDVGKECPWPGMPNDAPVPIDLMQMPFDAAMFLEAKGEFKRRVDRLQLMARIQDIWVPWLRSQLIFAGVQ